MRAPPEQTAVPIDAILAELEQALAGRDAAVLQAPPGAGKTTRVPLALLRSPWLAEKSILMLEPRRLAATNAARYMARLLGERVGETVGYAIRYERCSGAATRIEVVTEGILIRRLQSDPELAGVGLIIFDEFHERSLNSDLALALCRDAQQGLRPDLRLLVMSATLDAAPVGKLLGDAPLVTSAGRSFPVDIRYLAGAPRGKPAEFTAAAVRRALTDAEGDLLVFLPGSGDIHRCAALLADLERTVDIRPLYGDLPFAEQEKAILPGARRRVVLATNIAETSLTIEGVAVVVDCGLERRPRFDAARGMSNLETVPVSQASAAQRAGRAGRLGPGVCYRLWSEGAHGALLPFTPPEIRSADLTPLALELARWGITDPVQLAWLDPPPAGHLAAAREVLRRLGALDERDRLSPLGEQMAKLPVHPRLARVLVAAREAGCPGLGSDLVALLSERDVFALGEESPGGASGSDLLDRVETLQLRKQGPAARASRYWRRKMGARSDEASPDAWAVGRLLAVGFPDRLGREREPGSGRYLLCAGHGARLSPRSAARGEWLVALAINALTSGEGEIRLASGLQRQDVEDLFGERTIWKRETEWDDRHGRLVAREVRRLGALVLQERPAALRPEDNAGAMLAVVRRKGLEVLGWSQAARQWRARVQLIAGAFPEDDWPDLADETLLASLERWLGPFLSEERSLDELRRLDLLPALHSLLSWKRREELDRLAPERLAVPSGSAVRLDYTLGEEPVLAVKLQELFGLGTSPRIAAGRVPVRIHLLSPAGRPLAITSDLAGFWENVYPEVRKEMKGRYPKHPWPDDPWSAEPTRRTKRK